MAAAAELDYTARIINVELDANLAISAIADAIASSADAIAITSPDQALGPVIAAAAAGIALIAPDDPLKAGDTARAANAEDLKEVVAEQTLELRLLKKACSGPPGTSHSDAPPDNRWGRRRMRLALQASGCGQIHVVHKPRLLSENGSSYVSGDLAEWLQDKGIKHSLGAPYHPQTQGKIERRHQTLKNRILLENYFLPGYLEAQIEAFVDHYNHQRYHESLHNVTPADVYFGRDKDILKQRERIKQKTFEARRLHHRKHAA